mmetsp:Transcript_11571/g.31166  ORF Transcript_11571/g.31166 Transcript_11571/m.31166 type:complete len:319 (-) Transcript_11571:464-1420(-)
MPLTHVVPLWPTPPPSAPRPNNKFGIKMVVPIFTGLGVLIGRILEQVLLYVCDDGEGGNVTLCRLSRLSYPVCVVLGTVVGLLLLVFKTEEMRLKMDVGSAKSTTVHGRIEERFEPYEGAYSTSSKVWECCCGIVYSKLLQMTTPGASGVNENEEESLAKGLTSEQLGELQHAFTTRTAQCCFPACSCCSTNPNRHNNCYGGTCCKDRCVVHAVGVGRIAITFAADTTTITNSNTITDHRTRLIIDILDRQGQVVAHAARVYASGSGTSCVTGACCRMINGYSNYLLEFPPGATQRERVLLLASFIATDLELFDNNGQ